VTDNYRFFSFLFSVSPRYLFLLLLHYKLYPITRTQRQVMGIPSHGWSFSWRMHKWEEHLAGCIDELQEAWNARNQEDNHLPHVFDPKVVGCIDTFPIEINRPPAAHQRQYYNGKYAKHVVKVSIDNYR
jgi:hypothetical protein